MTNFVHRHRLLAPAAVALGLLTACSGGGESRKRAGASACRQSTDSATWQAVLAYIKAASPYPQRFLSAAGTDSALPDVGVSALQEKGPTYFFPADSASRMKVRKRMDDMGPYNGLLVAWHGSRRESDTLLVIRLGGRYIGGSHEGEVGKARAFVFGCTNNRWQLRRQEEEKIS